MSDLTTYPRQDNYETTLASEIGTTDTTFTVSDAVSFTLSSGDLYATIDPGLSSQENVKVTDITGNVWTITRAQPLYEGDSGTAYAHSGGAAVALTNTINYNADIVTAVNSKVDNTGDTMTGLLQFSGTTHAGLQLISLTTTERNALTPANGMMVYDETLGATYQYVSGSWASVDTGTATPNASATVAGKVEIATSAESIAGTDTGGTGALVSVLPSDIAANVQSATWNYAADAEASDAYAITLTPALGAYAAGDSIYFKANTANTGAATLNVNALGAKAIKKYHNEDLQTNDIESGSIVHVIYDGTNFQLQTGVGVNMSEANTFFGSTDISGAEAETLTDGSDADALHTHGAIDDTKDLSLNAEYGAAYDINLIDEDSTAAGGGSITQIVSPTNIISYDPTSNNGNVYYTVGATGIQCQSTLDFDSGTNVRFKISAAFFGANGDQGFGISKTATFIPDPATAAPDRVTVMFDDSASKYYFITSDASSVTSTDITAYVTTQILADYVIVWDQGTSAKLYIDGTLRATHTTNLPTADGNSVLFGLELAHSSDRIFAKTPWIIAVEKI